MPGGGTATRIEQLDHQGRRGAVAAGHPATATAGARVLRAGGNAVDAAIAAVLNSCVAEPLLTGLGAGGYMMVVTPDGEHTLLDFFVEAPGRGLPPGRRAELLPVDVFFEDALQVFHAGPASVGSYGTPAGLAYAAGRFGTVPLAELCAPAAALARDGVALSPEQAYVLDILWGIVGSTPESAAIFAPAGRRLRAGELLRNPELGDALERLGREGAEPFYRGEAAAAVVAWLDPRGGLVTPDDLAAYQVVERAPLELGYRERRVLLNPPPSAGGILIAHALDALRRAPGPRTLADVVAAMEAAQRERTPQFLEGLAEAAFAQRFLGRTLGSTTHISVLDDEGWACGVTCSNGSCSGVVVPGTGLHLNNMLGEQDLNPLGFHRYPAGRRLPSMMAPTVVLDDEGRPELVLGSGGSNRIRSALLQTIVNVVDRELDVQEAVDAPRVHVEGGVLYAEPGLETSALTGPDRALAPFRARNLFFGGVHAVRREPSGELRGAGDPRRGGAVAAV